MDADLLTRFVGDHTAASEPMVKAVAARGQIESRRITRCMLAAALCTRSLGRARAPRDVWHCYPVSAQLERSAIDHWSSTRRSAVEQAASTSAHEST